MMNANMQGKIYMHFAGHFVTTLTTTMLHDTADHNTAEHDTAEVAVQHSVLVTITGPDHTKSKAQAAPFHLFRNGITTLSCSGMC